MSGVLRVSAVHKSFETDGSPVEVLRGVSFEMEPGQTVAVIGPSGSGKSTLLHLVGTLDRPTSGTIEIDGVQPDTLAEKELARFRNVTVGFVFQEHHLLPQYSVLENVLVPTLVPRHSGKGVTGRAEQLIERVGLSHRKHHRPAELSGGERQRAAVARALINGPSLLLGDEPTGSLDGVTADRVASLLFELHREERNMLIVVTHSMELAGRCDRRFELRDGRCSEL